MINIHTLQALTDGDGLTLKNYEPIQYKSGWQVATEGYETTDVMYAMKLIKQMNGNCGVWYSGGTYFIDKSFRVATKTEAMRIGRAHRQISILKWSDMSLAFC